MSQFRLASASVSAPEMSHPKSADWVLLLHGLFASRRSMRHLECSSTTMATQSSIGVTQLGEHPLTRMLAACSRCSRAMQSNSQVRSINFVTHSMGGILVRSAQYIPNAIQRSGDSLCSRCPTVAPFNSHQAWPLCVVCAGNRRFVRST